MIRFYVEIATTRKPWSELRRDIIAAGWDIAARIALFVKFDIVIGGFAEFAYRGVRATVGVANASPKLQLSIGSAAAATAATKFTEVEQSLPQRIAANPLATGHEFAYASRYDAREFKFDGGLSRRLVERDFASSGTISRRQFSGVQAVR